MVADVVTAYVDESLRLDGRGLYVLAAVVVPASRAASVRATLLDAVPPGLRRYHWRRESTASRLAICDLTTRLDVDALAVVADHVDSTRPERARRQCLTRLLWELCERDVREVVLESRHAADACDRRLIAAAERSGWASSVHYSFGEPDRECLLWLADVVAGAVARALGDGDATYLDLMGDTVTIVSVP